jgi:UDP-N-acetylmuramyl pentapeptide phosphotransferase/UDP-N-acetylglucosamine-1-phosphate transferase
MAMFLGGLLGAVIVLDAGVSASLTVIAIVLIVLVVILTIVSRKPANWQGPAS